jgi:hypothetical protein
MHILGLLGMCFDAVVVKVKKNLLIFRVGLAILWIIANDTFHGKNSGLIN